MAAIDLIQFQGERPLAALLLSLLPISSDYIDYWLLISTVSSGSSGVSVGDFSTSTQQLRLVNHLLKFPGETLNALQTVSGNAAQCRC